MNSRIRYIDSLRGIAVIFMIQQHLLSWLWEEKWISYTITFPEHPLMLTINFMGNFAAPLFLLLAGAGAAMLSNKSGNSGSEVIKRGTFILLCGYVLNILSPHWFRPWSWYVLHTIGISIIVSPILMKLKTHYLLLTSLFIIMAPAFIQTSLGTPLMTGDSFMNDISRSGGILRISLAEGHFPLLPWIAFFIAGIICSRWIKEDRRRYILVAGIVLIASGFLLKGLYNYGYFFATGGRFFRLFVFTPYIYPAHPSLIFILAGIALFLLYASAIINTDRTIMKFLASAGRLSLTWFFLHIIFFNEILRLYGIHRNFSAPGTVLIIAFTISVILFLSSSWERGGFRFSIECIMRRILKLQ